MDYTPNRSPVKHIPIADDEQQTKFADEVFHDMDDASAHYKPYNLTKNIEFK